MSEIDEVHEAALKRIREAADIVTDKWVILGAGKPGVERTQEEHLADLKARFPWLNTKGAS